MMFSQLIDNKEKKEQNLTIIQDYIYNYPHKVNVSIHSSLISSFALMVWRIIAYICLSVRMLFVLQQYSYSLFDLFEYLTNLGFSLTWLYFSSICIDILLSKKILSFQSKSLPDLISVIYEVSFCLEFPITLLYWVILYNPSSGESGIQLVKDIGVHGFPCFCLLVDFVFNVYQFPFRHLLVVLGVAIIYLFINLGYSLETYPIYSPIDWKSIESYIWVILALSLAIGIFMISKTIWTRFRHQKVLTQISRSLLDKQSEQR